MLYQGIIGGGSSPVEPVDLSPVLLWTNPSPTSEFAAQTVSLDLTEYVGVIIEYNINTENQLLISRVYVKKDDNLNPVSERYFGSGSGTNRGVSRGISQINNEVISFLDCADGITKPENTSIIPAKIYGVQKYVVESVNNYKLTTINNITISQSYTVPSNIKKFLMNVLIHASKGTDIGSSVPLLIDTDTNISNQKTAAYVANTENVTTGIYTASVSYNKDTRELTLVAQTYSNYSTLDLCIHTVE